MVEHGGTLAWTRLVSIQSTSMRLGDDRGSLLGDGSLLLGSRLATSVVAGER